MTRLSKILVAGVSILLLSFGAGAIAQAIRGYVSIPGAYIWGYGIGPAVRGHTAASCARRCDATSGCLSFEIANGWCSLNKANRRTKPNILTRTGRYTYYEKATGAPWPTPTATPIPTPTPTPRVSINIHRNCRGPDGCIIGIADTGYARPGTARYQEGWRRLEGPFNSHPAAWRRACQIHNSGTARAPDIIAGRINCASLGVTASSRQNGIDRPGGDFRNFFQGRANANICASACQNDRRCRAWTWVRSGVQGRRSRCWLNPSYSPDE